MKKRQQKQTRMVELPDRDFKITDKCVQGSGGNGDNMSEHMGQTDEKY